MSTFSLSNFQAEVAARGMAKINRFEVEIVAPPAVAGFSDGKLVSLMCETAMLPPTRIQTSQQRLFGPPSLHPQFADYGGDNMSLQFYLDGRMEVKKFFDRWVDSIVSRRGGTVNYQSEYLCNKMTVKQLNEADNVIYSVQFTDVFPTAVNPVQLDLNQGNTVGRLNVTFAYRRWFETALPTPTAPPNAGINSNRIDRNLYGRELESKANVGGIVYKDPWGNTGTSGQIGDIVAP
jgi:hypothetical protein